MHDPNNVYYQKSLMKRLRFTTALFCLSITDPGRLAIALYSEGLINRLASMRAKLVTLTELERSQEKKPRTSMSYFLECLECPGETVKPNDKQLLLVGSAASNTDPTLLQLMRLRIPEKVGVNYKKFGTFILKDNEGYQVANIEYFNSNPEIIVYEILKKWLQEMPTPLTWGNLIQILRQTELNKLAEDVQRNDRDILAFS